MYSTEAEKKNGVGKKNLGSNTVFLFVPLISLSFCFFFNAKLSLFWEQSGYAGGIIAGI